MSDYPEHNKLRAIPERERAAAQDMFDFINHHYALCKLGGPEHNRRFELVKIRPAELMARFHGIDFDAYKLEQDAIFDAIKTSNQQA